MKKIGRLGEKVVGQWLQTQNYRLLEQNWYCTWGEIDLIVQDKVTKAIAFVEVKTRSKYNWDENGLLAVNLSKQQKLWKTASLFLAKHPHLAELPCRFDVALVSYKSLKGLVRNSTLNLELANPVTIGQPIIVDHYQFTIEYYLQSAFEL